MLRFYILSVSLIHRYTIVSHKTVSIHEAATVQTSAVIVYNLYNSSWSQDSCIRTSKSIRVEYTDRFSLVSVNVRVKLLRLQLERSETQQPISGPRMRL